MPNLATVIRDGRQVPIRLDEIVVPAHELAEFEERQAKWGRYHHRIGRELEYHYLLEVDQGLWLEKWFRHGGDRRSRSRHSNLMPVSPYLSGEFRKMGRLGHDQVRWAIRELRTNAKTREQHISRAAILAYCLPPPPSPRVPEWVVGSVTATLEIDITADDAEAIRQSGDSVQKWLRQAKGSSRRLAFRVGHVELHDEPTPDESHPTCWVDE